jgi:hypothetical protein
MEQNAPNVLRLPVNNETMGALLAHLPSRGRQSPNALRK